MLLEKDIMDRIRADFGASADEVLKIIHEAILKADHLKESRTLRCIIFLAEKDTGRLNKYLNAAIADPRDVMFWAEYVNHDDEIPKQIHDFSNAFDL